MPSAKQSLQKEQVDRPGKRGAQNGHKHAESASSVSSRKQTQQMSEHTRGLPPKVCKCTGSVSTRRRTECRENGAQESNKHPRARGEETQTRAIGAEEEIRWNLQMQEYTAESYTPRPLRRRAGRSANDREGTNTDKYNCRQKHAIAATIATAAPTKQGRSWSTRNRPTHAEGERRRRPPPQFTMY